MKYQLMLLMVWLPTVFLAQDKLNLLRAPTSPASGILDLQPKVVLQPKSYQALETALYSNFLNSNYDAVIPTDFALEFTPYWTENHKLSLANYLYPEAFMDHLVRNSSISLASTQNFILGDSTASNGLAFGYRTSFFFPNKKDKEITTAKIAAIQNDNSLKSRIEAQAFGLVLNESVGDKKEFITAMRDTVSNAITKYGRYNTPKEMKAMIETILGKMETLPELTVTTQDAFLDAFRAIIDAEVKTYISIEELQAYLKERQGLTIDIALASLLNFPTNSFEFSYLPKSSIWVTPSYRFSEKFEFLKLLAVFRYEWYLDDYYRRYFPEATTYQNNIDYGVSLSTDFKRFSVQFELVGRSSSATIPSGTDAQGNELFRKEKDSDVQYMGTFNYNLTDQIVLSYTLGSKFDAILNPDETLVSLLSLNFGFGSPTSNDLDLSKN